MVKDFIYGRVCNFKAFSRDKHRNITSDNKVNQFIKNVLEDEELKLISDENYLQYLLRINDYDDIEKYNFIFDYINNYIDDTSERYVSSYFEDDFVKNLTNQNNIFILAGTGKGKNFFVKECIIGNNKKKKVIIFVNRQTLLKQQKEIIKDNVSNPNDLIHGFKTKGKIMLNDTVMLVTYQYAASRLQKRKKKFINALSEAKYVVFDEIHYLLDDASYNKSVNYILDYLIVKKNSAIMMPKATKIFMSATMEEMLILFYKLGYAFDNYKGYYYQKDNKYNFVWNSKKLEINNYFLNIPTDYSYIEPFTYSNVNELYERIKETNEKWLIFVNNIEEGEQLRKEVNRLLGSEESAIFINAGNKDNKDFESIIDKEKFEERVLIATTVLYNGVNLKDKKLKNIVLPFVNVPFAKQMIGRKRIDDDEKVKVYFKNVKEEDVIKKFNENICDYRRIINFKKMSVASRVEFLNQTENKGIEYLWLKYENDTVEIKTNDMAYYKLYFDTMFNLYLLMNISKQQDSSYARIMLEHLGIGEKFKKIKENELLTEEKKHLEAQKKLIEWLEKYSDETNGTFKFIDGESKKLREFNVSFNDIYYMVYNRNVNTQYKRGDRSIPKKDIQQLIDELGLPYNVTIDAKNGDVKKVYIEKSM